MYNYKEVEKMNYQEASEILKEMTEEQMEAAKRVFWATSCLPMTGRYGDVNDIFSEDGSEYALNRNRLYVELRYLEAVCNTIGVELTKDDIATFDFIMDSYNIYEFFKMKDAEKTTNHDVKSIEYYVQSQLDAHGLGHLKPCIHMGLTSEDVNNIAYAMMMEDMLVLWSKEARNLLDTMKELALRTKDVPMLGHTHGQPATPLTFGHAVAVDWYRLKESYNILCELPIKMKCNGAVGNKAAMVFAYYNIDWDNFEDNFIFDLGVNGCEINYLTTQIENHDFIVRILNEMRLFSSIVENIGKNIEDYTMLGYLKQIPKKGEVGSSTMPNKINPIDGENAWSNAITAEFASIGLTQKLPLSKLQRDLSDSSSLRTIPTVFLHSYKAISSLIKMLGKLEVNEKVMRKDLEDHPEVISEAIQVVLRKNGYDNAYEIMKDMTRGKKVTLNSLRKFISSLEINEDDKQRLLELTPEKYIGNSAELVEYFCASDEEDPDAFDYEDGSPDVCLSDEDDSGDCLNDL